MQDGKKILSLQFLRGLAVVLVISAHAIDNTRPFGHSYIASFLHFENFGAVGVDIFFVISGAIMTIITFNKKFHFRNFLTKRFIRIIPMYWGASFFCVIISFLGLWSRLKAAEILQTITIIPFFKSGYIHGHILFLGWTLSFEFFFYFLFSTVLILNKRKTFIPILFIFLLITALRLANFPDERMNFFTNPIMLEFLFGMFCGHLYISNIRLSNSIAYFLTTMSIILLFSTVLYNVGNISDVKFIWDGSLSLHRVIIWGIPSFLLVAGLLLLEKNKSFSVNKLFIIAGDISYSAYLSHLFSLILLNYVWHHANLKMADFYILISIPFCLIIAYFVHKLIEKPLLSFLNRILFKKKYS